MSQSLISKRASVLKRTTPQLVATLFFLFSVSFTAYYSAVAFAEGTWLSGLVYAFGSLFLLWLYAPGILENWITIYIAWHLPSCDYLHLDRICSRVVNVLRFFRCANSAGRQHLALIKMYEGQYGDAEYLVSNVLRDLANTQWRNAPQYVILECHLASAFARQNRMDEARDIVEKAFVRIEDASDGFELYSMFPLLHSMSFDIEEGHLDKAKESLIALQHSIAAPKLPRGFSRAWLTKLESGTALLSAILFLRTGELEIAEKSYLTFFDFVARDEESINPLHVKWMNLLAREYLQNKMYDRAEDLLNLSYGLLRRIPNHPDCQQTLGLFRQLLLETNRKDQLEDMLAWVRPLNRELIGQDTN
jgi:tetratricopeptide (TPR) repeat protein